MVGSPVRSNAGPGFRIRTIASVRFLSILCLRIIFDKLRIEPGPLCQVTKFNTVIWYKGRDRPVWIGNNLDAPSSAGIEWKHVAEGNE